MEKIRKFHFWSCWNKIKPIIHVCFVYAFDQSDGQSFVQKIWGTASYFFENWTRGISYLKGQQLGFMSSRCICRGPCNTYQFKILKRFRILDFWFFNQNPKSQSKIVLSFYIFKASVTILADFGPEFNSPFRWRSNLQTKKSQCISLTWSILSFQTGPAEV